MTTSDSKLARIVLHINDPLLEERRCFRFSYARCQICKTKVAGEMHIHVLFGEDDYAGYCSEECAIQGINEKGLILVSQETEDASTSPDPD